MGYYIFGYCPGSVNGYIFLMCVCSVPALFVCSSLWQTLGFTLYGRLGLLCSLYFTPSGLIIFLRRYM